MSNFDRTVSRNFMSNVGRNFARNFGSSTGPAFLKRPHPHASMTKLPENPHAQIRDRTRSSRSGRTNRCAAARNVADVRKLTAVYRPTDSVAAQLRHRQQSVLRVSRARRSDRAAARQARGNSLQSCLGGAPPDRSLNRGVSPGGKLRRYPTAFTIRVGPRAYTSANPPATRPPALAPLRSLYPAAYPSRQATPWRSPCWPTPAAPVPELLPAWPAPRESVARQCFCATPPRRPPAAAHARPAAPPLRSTRNLPAAAQCRACDPTPEKFSGFRDTKAAPRNNSAVHAPDFPDLPACRQCPNDHQARGKFPAPVRTTRARPRNCPDRAPRLPDCSATTPLRCDRPAPGKLPGTPRRASVPDRIPPASSTRSRDCSKRAPWLSGRPILSTAPGFPGTGSAPARACPGPVRARRARSETRQRPADLPTAGRLPGFPSSAHPPPPFLPARWRARPRQRPRARALSWERRLTASAAVCRGGRGLPRDIRPTPRNETAPCPGAGPNSRLRSP